MVRRIAALLLIFVIFAVAFTGCIGGKNDLSGKREINSPSRSEEEDDEVSSEMDSNDLDEGQESSSLPEGTISSLDEIKERVVDAGYETSELFDMQKEVVTSLAGDVLVDGFNIVIGSVHNFVMEFKTPEDAQEYADMINEGGYNVAIVNGRFLTSVEATKGIIEDEELQAELEAIMDAKAQVQENWTDVEAVSTSTSDYKGAYALKDMISRSMNTLLEQSIAENNKAHPSGDPKNIDGVFPLQFNSIPLSLTSTFCEDETQLQAVVSVVGMLGMTDGKVTRNAAHDYTLTAKKTRNNAAYEVHGKYDPATGSLRMVEKTDGEVTEFVEFVPLGGVQYAMQSNTERAIVNYKDNELISYRYTKLDDKQDDYDSESDSIYPSGKGVDLQWVAPLGEDGYGEYYNLDNGIIKLSVQSFGGKRVKAEIPAK